MTPDVQSYVKSLLGEVEEGHALPRAFYTSQDIYELDIANYWNQSWIWVGHISQLPNSGDYILFDYGHESVIILRDKEGDIRAHLNVCRHRGSRICTEQSGNARLLVCPYHAWTYELSGALRAGAEMGANFDPSKFNLHSAHVRVFQGLIFVCVAKDAPDFDAAVATLADHCAPFGFERLKVAHEASYPVPANWKLAVENYMECYHCGPAHKEYSRSHSLKSPKDVAALAGAMAERSTNAGLPIDEISFSGVEAIGGIDIYYRRYPLYDGYKTGSKSGGELAPLLGDLSGYDGGTTDLQIGVINNFLVYSDHLIGYRFVPRGLQETDIQIVWLVREDAQQGRDYDKEDLTWLWHVTSQDDERIIRHNQEGVNSNFFAPGPLSEMEWGIDSFYHGYLAQLRRAVG